MTPRTAARQASPSFTVSRRLLKLMSIESVMLSHNLTLCWALLLLLSIFPSISLFQRVAHIFKTIWLPLPRSHRMLHTSSRLSHLGPPLGCIRCGWVVPLPSSRIPELPAHLYRSRCLAHQAPRLASNVLLLCRQSGPWARLSLRVPVVPASLSDPSCNSP